VTLAPRAGTEAGVSVPPLIRRNTLSLAATQAFVGTGTQLVPTLGGITVERLLGSLALAGLGTSLSYLARLLIAYPIGWVMDTCGRKVGLLLGLALRVAGNLTIVPFVTALGLVSTAFAYVLFALGLQVFARRRKVAGARTAWFRDAAQWHGVSAFVWLLLDAGLLFVGAMTFLLHGGGNSQRDIDRHILGAGFITLLILGEGANLLPGFGAGPLRSQTLVWATLLSGNAAAFLRIGPVALPWLVPGQVGELALSLSGLAGVFAVAVFGLNLRAGKALARARPLVSD